MSPSSSPSTTSTADSDPASGTLPPRDAGTSVSGDPAAAWADRVKNQCGYRTGSSSAPTVAQQTIEVSSRLQLPEILKAVQENKSPIRLVFPAPTAGTAGADAIQAEQKAVRDFMLNYSSRMFGDIARAIAQEVEKSCDFAQVKGTTDLSGEAWVTSHGLNTRSALSLKVTSVYNANSAVTGGAPELAALLVKLAPHLTDTRAPKAILTITPGNAQALADALLEKISSGELTRRGISNVAVWVGNQKNTFSGGAITDSDCLGMIAMSLEDFLKRYKKNNAVENVVPEASNRREEINPQPSPGRANRTFAERFARTSVTGADTAV